MIDDRFLEAYIAEVGALRVHGREFARSHPDIATRLDIGPGASRDAHVERVTESAAFLTARLRQMLDVTAAELPLSMLTVLAPAVVEPVPSMAIAEVVDGTAPQPIPRGSRFDANLGGRQICFRTTMAITAVPMVIRTEPLDPAADSASGIDVHLGGRKAPDPLLLHLGSDRRTGAVLMDAIDQHLASISMVAPGGERREVPRRALRIHGFAPEDAALPVRRMANSAHRIMTEFLVFPDKYRFMSLQGVDLPSGARLQFRFDAPLPLPLPADLISVNRVPVINLWSTRGTPIELNGRWSEYPVRADNVRYRSVECHSVEAVDLFSSASNEAQRLDPVIAAGEVSGSKVRWGVRRGASRQGGEILLYFRGLGHGMLGRERVLAIPSVLASNSRLARHLAAGAELIPLQGLGTWRGRLVTAPTEPCDALTDEAAMMELVGYLRSGMAGPTPGARGTELRDFLRRFPGGRLAPWIDGIGAASSEPVTVLRRGRLRLGVSIRLRYDATRQPTISQAMVRRVLGQLLQSLRGVHNRVEEVRLYAF